MPAVFLAASAMVPTFYWPAHFKATPSIASNQKTINKNGENIEVSIRGRHDPIIGPRAAVVVESMAAITILDLLFDNMSSRMDNIIQFYKKERI